MGEQGSLQVADGHVADVATRVTAHASHSLGGEEREGEGKGVRRGREGRGGKGGERRGEEGGEGRGDERRKGIGVRGGARRVNINTTNMDPLVHTTSTCTSCLTHAHMNT